MLGRKQDRTSPAGHGASLANLALRTSRSKTYRRCGLPHSLRRTVLPTVRFVNDSAWAQSLPRAKGRAGREGANRDTCVDWITRRDSPGLKSSPSPRSKKRARTSVLAPYSTSPSWSRVSHSNQSRVVWWPIVRLRRFGRTISPLVASRSQWVARYRRKVARGRQTHSRRVSLSARLQPHFESPQLRHVMQPSIMTTAAVLHLLQSCAPCG